METLDRALKESQPPWQRRMHVVASVVVVAPGLYVLSRTHYLVFHSLIELLGVAIMAGMFTVAWNARKYPGNDYFVVYGNTALLVSLVLIFHTLAYRGMGVFPNNPDANLATQLWLVSRWLLAGGLFAAPLTAGRGKVKDYWLMVGLVATAVLLVAAFAWSGFPDAYVEGQGLTTFKVASEYVVIAVLAGALALTWRIRESFDRTVITPVMWSIGLLIGSELFFTLYSDVYGIMNFLGHLLQAGAFILAYNAFVRTGVKRPMALWFRQLRRDRDWLDLQNRRLQALLDDLPLPYQSLDENGCFVAVNKAWEETLGYDTSEVLGRCFSDLVIEEQRDQFPKRFDTFKSIGSVAGVHWDLTLADGTVAEVSIDGRVARDVGGGFERTHCVFRELRVPEGDLARPVLERSRLERQLAERTRELEKYAEQLSESNQVKTSFLANMSHELRTPLNSIIGFSGILKQGMAGDLQTEQLKQIEMINASGVHLLQIVDDLLDLAKIEAGAVSFDYQPGDLVEVCRNALASFRIEAEAKGIELRFTEHGEPCHHLGAARLDVQKVRQILFNLLSNALKFTSEGSVTVDVDCDRATSFALIRVTDTGVGIAPEMIAAVFEEFEQVTPASGAAKTSGTGLGLPISLRLARLMGGDLTASSRPGAGSTFTLTLPLRIEE